MKSAIFSLHEVFPETPISLWAGARRFGWTRSITPGGQLRRPQRIAHPFLSQRKM